MRNVILAILGIAWGWGIFFDAGVPREQWAWSLGALSLAAALYFGKVASGPGLSRFESWTLGGFCGIGLLQIAPLPMGLISWLSPERANLIRAADFLPRTRAVLSSVPDLTLEWLVTLAGCVVVFLIIRGLSRHAETPWSVVVPLLFVGLAEAILGLVQFYSAGAAEGLARGTYANRNHYAGLLEMSLPFAILWAVAILRSNRDRFHTPAGPVFKACILLAIAATMLLGVVHSLSRMGFLATIGSLFIMATLALGSSFPGWKRWIPVAAVGVGALLCAVYLPIDALIARFADIASSDEIKADTRAVLWQESMALVRAYPAVGCGLGGYESCFMKYKAVAPMSTANFAHNDYLQIMVEMGLPAFLLGLILVLRIFGHGVRRAALAHDPSQRYLAVACTGSLTAMLLHSFTDFNLYMPANAMLMAWVLGLTARSIGERGKAGA